MPDRLKKVAIIGGGIAGLYSAMKLKDRFHVTIFEAGPELGGHEKSVLTSVNQVERYLDMGFLIYNCDTYPLFTKYLRAMNLASEIQQIDMSVLFYDRSNKRTLPLGFGLLRFWQILIHFGPLQLLSFVREFRIFKTQANRDLAQNISASITFEAYLKDRSDFFRNFIMKPYVQAIWSNPGVNAMSLPAKSVLGFMRQHLLLDSERKSTWQSLKSSSRAHINRFSELFDGVVHLNASVTSVVRSKEFVSIISSHGAENFDAVIIAVQADQALKILEDPTVLELDLLGQWTYINNKVVLHTDESILPKSRSLWGAWNVDVGDKTSTITYYLNKIHCFVSSTTYLVTLGSAKIDTSKILHVAHFRHPVFSSEALVTQSRLPQLNACKRSYFCGSYFGFGFHEDAIQSAELACQKLLDQEVLGAENRQVSASL